jgi:hypothetical protein
MSLKPDSSGAGDEFFAMRPSVVAGLSGIASLAVASRFTAGSVVQALKPSTMASGHTSRPSRRHTGLNMRALAER